jgi:hypothetical protein
MVDYQQELKRLQEGASNYWKPKAGQFKVKALSELEDTEPYVKKREGQEDEVTEQAKLKILVDGEEKIWTFSKGKTQASTYGQLVELATRHANQLNGVEFKVVIKFDGTKNDYTIVE